MSDRFVIDYQVIGKCNLDCNFCDGAPKEYQGERTEVIVEGIDKLRDAGATTIVFTGGEPLLRKDISTLIDFAWRKGLEVYLSTNALRLFRYYDEIKDKLSCLGIPLDGSTPEVSERMSRGRAQFHAATLALKHFKDNPPAHRVKVGTVVSKLNRYDIPNIGNYLFNNPQGYAPNTWRLYQFTPILEGKKSKVMHEMSDQEFEESWKMMRNAFPNNNVSPLSNADSDSSYIFINPIQEIQVLIGEEYRVLGNLKTINLDELKALRRKSSNILQRSQENRRWLDEK